MIADQFATPTTLLVVPYLFAMLRKRNDGRWLVYDVEVENVSMVSSYRDSYRDIVSRDGLDGLLEQMRAKAAPVPEV